MRAMTSRPSVLTLMELFTGVAALTPPPGFVPHAEISSAVVDSRLVKAGSLFVAMEGAHQDGHDFIPEAIANGAVAIIAERVPSSIDCDVLDVEEWQPDSTGAARSIPLCLVVPNSLDALQQAATYWRGKHDVGVIGITGSVGKTTTKEVVAAVVRQRYQTLKSEGNYNNEIGLPLTLLVLTAVHQRVVLEMGMYDLGEITHLTRIALPQVGIVTNVGPTHLERLGTIERIAQAKSELPQALPPADEGGIAILNGDQERVAAMAADTRARVFTYGLSPKADLWADNIESAGLEGIHFRFHYGDDTIHARVPMLGRHSVHTALCAAAVGLVEGMPWEEIMTGLRDQSAQLRLVAVLGPSGSIILDDTYNSSPTSCIAALNLLNEVGGRRIAVLGGMFELGSHEEEGHKIVGRRACDTTDLLITVGPLGEIIGEEAIEAGMDPESVYMVESSAQAVDLVRTLLKAGPSGDRILVKGSRGMEMEQIVAALQKGDLS